MTKISTCLEQFWSTHAYGKHLVPTDYWESKESEICVMFSKQPKTQMQIDKGGKQMKQMLQKAEEETIFFLIFFKKITI